MVFKSFDPIRNFLKEILIIFLTLIRIVLTPIFILIFLPIYTWRVIVSWLSGIFRPDLVKMVVTRSSIMAVDDWSTAPRCNLVVTVGFEGELDLKDLFKNLDGKIINRKNDNGEEVHPELKQYYEKWMGFIFWKYEDNFKLEDHIRYYEQDLNQPITTTELTRIESEATHNPFQPNKSPWEVFYVRNFKPDFDTNPTTQKSIIIFRLHHGIADGYSLLNLLLREIGQLHEHEYAVPNYGKKKSFCQRSMNKIKYALKSQYEAARQRVDCTDFNEWRMPKSKMSKTWYHVRSKPIPITMLKEIKTAYGVSFTAMLISGISGGIRRYLVKRGQSIPENMHYIAPFPVPRNTTKLRNFYSFAYLRFPVGIENPRTRMLTVEKYIADLKKSTTPISNFMQLPAIGGLNAGLIKSFGKNLQSTGIISNFPGPFNQCTFMGLPVTELGFTGGLLRGNQGIGFACLSYLGYLNIRAGGCQSLFPEESDLKDLIREIEAEFLYLSDSVQV